ncbi:MAG: hypothetical protein EBX41_00880 [Chitinophagia bacterium]|nr:hypothetical protein [Chitinophagia bacterium]
MATKAIEEICDPKRFLNEPIDFIYLPFGRVLITFNTLQPVCSMILQYKPCLGHVISPSWQAYALSGDERVLYEHYMSPAEVEKRKHYVTQIVEDITSNETNK